jgi:hypothetical protein
MQYIVFKTFSKKSLKILSSPKAFQCWFLKTKMNCETSINYKIKKKKGGINQMYNDKQVLMIIY